MSITKLLLIHPNVKDPSFITDRINITTTAFINVGDDTTITDANAQLTSKGVTKNNITNIGLVYDNRSNRVPFFQYTDSENTRKNAIINNTLNPSSGKYFDYLSYTRNKTFLEKDVNSISSANILPTGKTNPNDVLTSITNGIRSNVTSRVEPFDKNTDAGFAYVQGDPEELRPFQPVVPDNDPLGTIPYVNSVFANDKTASYEYFSDMCVSFLNTFTNVANIDLISCNIDFNTTDNAENNARYNGLLTTLIRSKIRFSTDITGNGGDWILEKAADNSTPNTDLKPLYFPNTVDGKDITQYQYALYVCPSPLPTTIITEDDLYCLMITANPADLAQSYTLLAGKTFDMTPYACESIGKLGIPFTGDFNGNNALGTKIKIGNVNPTGFYGLFGFCQGTPLNNVIIQNVNVEYVNPITLNITSANPIYYGGLCGFIGEGQINTCNITYNQNLSVTGVITSAANGFMGTLAGYVYKTFGTTNSVLCSQNVTFQLTTNPTSGNNGRSFMGGLIGLIESIQGTVRAKIELSTLTINGNLSITGIANSVTAAGRVHIGGICGGLTRWSNINNCDANIYGTTDILGNSGSNGIAFIGGIIGLTFLTDTSLAQYDNVNIAVTYYNPVRITVGTAINACYTSGLVAYAQAARVISCTATFKRELLLDSYAKTGSLISGILVGQNLFEIIQNCSVISESNIISNNNGGNVTTNQLITGGLIGLNANAGLINLCSLQCKQLTISNNNSGQAILFSGVLTGDGEGGRTLNNSVNCTSFNINSNTAGIDIISGNCGYITSAGAPVDTLYNENVVTSGKDNIINSQGISTDNTYGVAVGGVLGFAEGSKPSGYDYTFTDNTLNVNNRLTYKANQQSTNINVNAVIAKNTSGATVLFNTTSFINNDAQFVSYLPDSKPTGITFNSINYPIPGTGILTITGPNFLIDLSDITVFLYINEIIPKEAETCCIANVLNPNPQTTNFDTSITTTKAGNSAMVTSVNDFYTGVSTGKRTVHSQPVFSSYQAYIQYLQGLNRR
jgi:hypothetical protein